MRVLTTAAAWALTSLLYYTLVNLMDREGMTGTLFDASPPLSHSLALVLLLALRGVSLLLLPALLFAFLVEALLARFVRGSAKANGAESSMVEASQIGGEP